MKPLSYREVLLEAFVHATESPEAVERALRLILPEGEVERRELGGHFGQKLTHLALATHDPAAIASTVARVKAAVGREVGESAHRRVSRDLALHLRLDKQAAFRGEIRLESNPANDVVKLRLRLRAPGLEQEAAAALVQREFSRGNGPEEE